jgi:acyl-CoA synthetase (AMP-forming)/AMP-acid ligase II
VHAALPLERDVRRHDAGVLGGRRARHQRERFSASKFAPDVLPLRRHVLELRRRAVHYVPGGAREAVRRRRGEDPERGRAEPEEPLRYALGNGAAPPDIDKFMRWFGLEDVFELYGSTEAAISTFRKKGDPRGSVGEITDAT